MMNKYICVIVCLFIASFTFIAVAGDRAINGSEDESSVGVLADVEAIIETVEKPFCPKTRISDNDRCLDCHVAPDFKLKEAKPDRTMNLPYGSKLLGDKLYFVLTVVSDVDIQRFFDYVYWHPEIKHVIIEVHSPGGSLLDAWKVIGLMQEAEQKGIIVETRCYGFAASAGFLVFVAGTMGNRFVNPNSELMHHELWTFKFFDVSSPSKKENEADVLRHLQDNIHRWLVKRSTQDLTKETLDDWVKHKDYWMSGQEAIDIGFADGVIK